MLVLSRVLDLREVGFASALAAVYASFELVTDINMPRFVLTAPREDYQEALASAHALSALRGAVVASIAFLASPLIASFFSLGSQWLSFASVALIIIVRSLEHVAPRIAERDYQYGPQLKVATVAYGLSLAALFASVVIWRSHIALIMSLLAQAIGIVVGSRIFSKTPYRWRLRTPYFRKAFNFGYPLMFNGLGLAISGQADRFLVGGILSLSALGIYSVLTLVTVIPSSIVSRAITTVTVALLFNSANDRRLLQARLRLASRLIPLVAAAVALGILTLLDVVTPLVFGRSFVASRWMVVLLAFATFVRIARLDPGTAVLLNEGRTKRLALANLAVSCGLVFAGVFMILAPEIEAAALGRCLGELGGLAVILYLTRRPLQAVLIHNLSAIGASAALMGVASVFVLFTSVGSDPVPSFVFLALGAAALGLAGARTSPLFAQAGLSFPPTGTVKDAGA
jgi:O-antigen/teichoic acid export membrane protein